MFGTTIELRLLAGAHLVVYLTWIVLFQEKHLPQYWWMCALSVLQVAIGSILTISSSYGGMLLGIHVRFDLDAVGLFAVPGPSAIRPIERAMGDAARTGAGEPPGRRAVDGSAAAEEPVRALLMQRSTARGTMQLDPDERWLGMRFALSMLAISGGAFDRRRGILPVYSAAVGGTDRMGCRTRRNNSASAAMTGFTTEVRLGDMVPALGKLQASAAGQPFQVPTGRRSTSRPIAKGSAMPSPCSAARRWKCTSVAPGRGPDADRRSMSLPQRTGPARAVRQQILMEPLGSPILFAIEPFDAVRLPGAGETVEWQPITGQIFRPDSLPPDKALAYDVFTTEGGKSPSRRSPQRSQRSVREPVFRAVSRGPRVRFPSSPLWRGD